MRERGELDTKEGKKSRRYYIEVTSVVGSVLALPCEGGCAAPAGTRPGAICCEAATAI